MNAILSELKAHKDILRAEIAESPVHFQSTVLFSVRYRSDDCEVEGLFAIPKDFYDSFENGCGKKLSAVICNRGGNREFGILKPNFVCRYADRGFFTLGSQYRGNCGGTGREEFGGKDVNDVIKLIDIALSLSFVEQKGVYMIGHSRGGMMTYLACTRDERILAAAVGSGLADCSMMYAFREESMKQVFRDLVGGSPSEVPEEYGKRSATKHAAEMKCPILICQGTDDWRVLPAQAHAMDRELKKAGIEHKLKIYIGADHSLMGTDYYDQVVEWFNEHK